MSSNISIKCQRLLWIFHGWALQNVRFYDPIPGMTSGEQAEMWTRLYVTKMLSKRLLREFKIWYYAQGQKF